MTSNSATAAPATASSSKTTASSMSPAPPSTPTPAPPNSPSSASAAADSPTLPSARISTATAPPTDWNPSTPVAPTPAAYGITLQIDGGIIAVGTTDTAANGNFVVARVDPNTGLLDTGFGTNGFTTTSFGSAAAAGAVAVLPNNDILAAGNSGSNVVLACYTPSGVLDTTFGNNGTEVVPGLTTANWQVGLALESSGKILVAAADGSGHLAVERLNSDGSVDSSFGSSGIATVNPGGTGAQATSIVVQSGGQIVLGGYAHTQSGTEAVAATLSASGAAQNNFSGSDFTTLNAVATASGTVGSAAVEPIGGGVVLASSTASATEFSKLSTAAIAPTATLAPTTITSPTGTATFTVVYNDDVAIDPTTVGSGNVTVSNGTQSFQVTSATPSSQSPGSPLTVTYMPSPRLGGEFSFAENGRLYRRPRQSGNKHRGRRRRG